MINDLVNRNKGFFNNIANQLGEMSNEIFKYFKLGFQPEPKAFKRTRNRWRRSGNTSKRELVEFYWTGLIASVFLVAIQDFQPR